MKPALKKVVSSSSSSSSSPSPGWTSQDARIFASFYRSALEGLLSRSPLSDPDRLLLSHNPDDPRVEEINVLTQRAAAIAMMAFEKWQKLVARRTSADAVKEFNQKVGR